MRFAVLLCQVACSHFNFPSLHYSELRIISSAPIIVIVYRLRVHVLVLLLASQSLAHGLSLVVLLGLVLVFLSRRGFLLYLILSAIVFIAHLLSINDSCTLALYFLVITARDYRSSGLHDVLELLLSSITAWVKVIGSVKL